MLQKMKYYIKNYSAVSLFYKCYTELFISIYKINNNFFIMIIISYIIYIKNLSICFKNIYCKISIKKIFLHKYLLYSRIIQDQ